MVEAIKNFFTETFSNPYVAGVLISMLPLIELRGGLPYLYFRLTLSFGETAAGALWKSFLVSWLGSSLVCPILLLFFMPVLKWLKSTKGLRKFGEWLERKFTKKSKKVVVEQNGEVVETPDAPDEQQQKTQAVIKYSALFVFTAIPLPLTGVWTASAVAALLGLDFKKSLFWIVLGNLFAGAAISLISLAIGQFI